MVSHHPVGSHPSDEALRVNHPVYTEHSECVKDRGTGDVIDRVWSRLAGIRKCGLFRVGDKILVGVSGGPDSVGLVLILQKISEEYHQNWRLILAHLNHQIRGRSAERDESFVKKLGKRLNLPVYTKKTDVPLLARRKKLSLETAARAARYDFLERVARRLKTRTVAVAHTLDDNAETVLMNILRGSGLRGLRGIPSLRGIHLDSRINIVRPLIETGRSEIRRFLKVQVQTYRLDRSNLQTEARRNLIRLKILPYLERYQPKLKQHLVRLSEISTETLAYLDRDAKTWVDKKGRRVKRGLSFNLRSLGGINPALRNAVFIRAIQTVKGDLKKIIAQHYDSLNDLISNPARGLKEIHLPDGLVVQKRGQKISFVMKSSRPDVTSGRGLRPSNVFARCSSGNG